MKTSIAINILGQQFTVRSGASPEEARDVADFVNRQLAEISQDRTVDSLQLAVMTLLNVSGSLLRLQRETREERDRIETGLHHCLDRIATLKNLGENDPQQG